MPAMDELVFLFDVDNTLIGAGQLRVDNLISHTFPLENFATARDTFVNRRDGAIKGVVEPN